MRRLLFAILVSMMLANSLYAKGGKGSVSKGAFTSKQSSSQPATTQQKRTDTPNHSTSAQAQDTAHSKPAPLPATGSSASTPTSTPNAPAGNPSFLQSVMPALVGGAVGSYVGSKLANEGDNEKPAEGNEAKKEEEHLMP